MTSWRFAVRCGERRTQAATGDPTALDFTPKAPQSHSLSALTPYVCGVLQAHQTTLPVSDGACRSFHPRSRLAKGFAAAPASGHDHVCCRCGPEGQEEAILKHRRVTSITYSAAASVNSTDQHGSRIHIIGDARPRNHHQLIGPVQHHNPDRRGGVGKRNHPNDLSSGTNGCQLGHRNDRQCRPGNPIDVSRLPHCHNPGDSLEFFHPPLKGS